MITPADRAAEATGVARRVKQPPTGVAGCEANPLLPLPVHFYCAECGQLRADLRVGMWHLLPCPMGCENPGEPPADDEETESDL